MHTALFCLFYDNWISVRFISFFSHIFQGFFTGTKTIMQLHVSQRECSCSEGMCKIVRILTTAHHNTTQAMRMILYLF